MQITRRLTLLLMMSIFVIGCTEEDKVEVDSQSEGRLQVSITDAPVDDLNVEAVFITATAIELDNEVYTFDAPKTIEISSLTEGKTDLLIDEKIDAKSYEKVSLILDYGDDGATPGCYVMTYDGVKHILRTPTGASTKLTISNSKMDVVANNTNVAVIDFDLRKALKYDEANGIDKYDFTSNLSESLRLVSSNNVTLKGTVKDDLGYAEGKVIVYAYKEGTFNQHTEMMTNSEVQFKGAISSTEVKSDGTFEIHFLEKGDYEIHLVNYEEDGNGKLEAHSLLNTSLTSMADLSVLNLESNTEVNLLVIGALEI